MNLKYLFSGCLVLAFVSFSTFPVWANNGENDSEEIVIEDLKTEADIEAAQNLLAVKVERLRAEKKMALTKSEKKALRGEIKEVKSDIKAVKEAAKRISGGVYLGTGALLAIILVLLLL